MSSRRSKRDSQVPSSQRSQKQRQTTVVEQFQAQTTQIDVDELANACVRYIVYNAGHQVVFRKAEIQKNAVHNASRQFEDVIKRAAEILKDVYGYNMLVCDQGPNASKAYIISNALPYMSYSKDDSDDQTTGANKILLLLILSHLFMSNTAVSEASLLTFLSNLNIDIEDRDVRFGHVRNQITSGFVKHKYLAATTDPVSKKMTYTWGLRAEKEISKHKILQFVSEIYKNPQPKLWDNHFKIAEEQGFENKTMIGDESMDVDE